MSNTNTATRVINVGETVTWTLGGEPMSHTGTVIKVGEFCGQPALWVDMGAWYTQDGRELVHAGRLVEIVDVAWLDS